MADSIYDIRIKGINGKEISMPDFKGKKLMVVNVASECGLTPQYAALQELYDTYKDTMAILACPCNDFGGQDPDSEENIEKFCSVNYGVTFTVTQKAGVINDPHPLYQWLTQKAKNGVADTEVTWNFQKFLIEPDGTWFKSISPVKSPDCDDILQWLSLQ